jgi:hypothetical protein
MIEYLAVIQGGLELSENTLNAPSQPELVRSEQPSTNTVHRNSIGGEVTLAPAPPLSIDFLTSNGGDVVSAEPVVKNGTAVTAQEQMRSADQTAQNSWPSDLLQLPSAYWNDALPTATMDLQGTDYLDFSPATGFSDMSFGSFHPTPDAVHTQVVNSARGPLPHAKASSSIPPPHSALSFDNPGQDSDASNYLVSWMLGALGRQ